jgi:ABC-2 type transport system permease protein
MIRHIFSFELKYRLKKISTYIYFGMFFLLGFFILCRTSVGGGPLRKLISAGIGNINANAPYVLYYLITLMSHFGLLITAAFFSKAAYRDFKENTYSLYFSYPIKKIDYLLGRFSGAFLSTLFVFSGVGIGALLGSLSPFVNPEKISRIDLLSYILPYLYGVLPNVLFAGALFFSLALVTRKFFSVYTGAAAVIICHLAANSFLQSQNDLLASLIDPFGNIAARGFYAYWTAAQKNSLLIPLSGNFLFNRIIWITLGITLLVIMFKKFHFSHLLESKKRQLKLSQPTGKKKLEMPNVVVNQVFNFKNHLRQMLYTSFLEFKALVKNPYFLVILLLGIIFIFIVGCKNVGLVRGTQSYPVTSQVLETTKLTLYLFCLIIILFGSGELVWRERNKKVQEIYDALPVPDWVPFLGKLGALILVQVLMMLIVMLSGIIIQILHDYYRFELGLYIKELLGIRLIYYILVSIFAMCTQVLVNKKFLGYVIVFLFIDDFFPSVGLTHHLWNFASVPAYTYSDMNGYGPFVKPIIFFNLYWSSLAVLLIVSAILSWVRGNDRGLKQRLKLAKTRLTKAKIITAGVSILLCLLLGGYILYNTNILNRFESTTVIEMQKVAYEKTYKKYENLPQPCVKGINIQVDIYPFQRKVNSQGHMTLENRTGFPIRELFIQMPKRGWHPQPIHGQPDAVLSGASSQKLVFFASFSRILIKRVNNINRGIPSGCFLKESDKTLGVYIYEFHHPLEPGEKLVLDFNLEMKEKGFKNHSENTGLVHNGTFLSNLDLIPAIGYDPYFQEELNDNDKRKKYGLTPKERIPSINDQKAKMTTPIARDAGWIDFEAIVSTARDQTAVTSGELIKEWIDVNRRYFHYKTRGKILKYLPFISAAYCVKKDQWQDVGIEIYYHQGHDYNVNLMIEAIKKSLRYFTANFSPYQLKQVKIVEFPRYELYGEAFPGVIPISEGYGFIAKFDDSKVAYIFRVTAHEVAHMWWGHQVIGANVQGMFVLSEVMAQYSALMVTKKEYDQDKIKQYIKKRLDNYLKGRARETEKEVPLALTNNETAYLHYEKGMVVMNALQDYIGEDQLNTALGKYIRKVAFQEPPFTTSLEWLQCLKEVTPDHLKYILTDMFETITLYENEAVNATYKSLPGGKFLVKLKFAAHKSRADEIGNEKEIEIRDYITFGVFAADNEPLYLKKHWVNTKTGELEFVVDRLPVRAGIDPYYFLVDKNAEDNVVNISRNPGH